MAQDSFIKLQMLIAEHKRLKASVKDGKITQAVFDSMIEIDKGEIVRLKKAAAMEAIPIDGGNGYKLLFDATTAPEALAVVKPDGTVVEYVPITLEAPEIEIEGGMATPLEDAAMAELKTSLAKAESDLAEAQAKMAEKEAEMAKDKELLAKQSSTLKNLIEKQTKFEVDPDNGKGKGKFSNEVIEKQIEIREAFFQV